jgi:hypothetical protein
MVDHRERSSNGLVRAVEGCGHVMSLRRGSSSNAFFHDNRAAQDLPPDPGAMPRSYYAHTAMGVVTPAAGPAVNLALLSGEDIARAADFPVMPSTLWFSLSCFGAFESSFARSVIGRGCPYYIGSRRSWAGHVGSTFLRELFTSWQVHDYAPAQLEASFRAVAVNNRTACASLFRRSNRPIPGLVKMIHAAPPHTYTLGQVSWGAGTNVTVEMI